MMDNSIVYRSEKVVFSIILWELSQTDHGFYHFYSQWINYLSYSIHGISIDIMEVQIHFILNWSLKSVYNRSDRQLVLF